MKMKRNWMMLALLAITITVSTPAMAQDVKESKSQTCCKKQEATNKCCKQQKTCKNACKKQDVSKCKGQCTNECKAQCKKECKGNCGSVENQWGL